MKIHRLPRVSSLFLFLFLLCGNAGIKAQEPGTGIEELIPGLKDRAVVLDIDARVVEQNKAVIWKEAHQRLTIPGRAVGMNLVGANLAVAVQFTPYLHARGQKNTLVAQVQMWVEAPNQGGIRYQTSIQTIPLDFDDPVYFFPLGSAVTEDSPRIEIMITLKHYKDPAAPARPGMPANASGKNR